VLSSSATPTRQRSPLKFFVLVFALTAPFWAIGAVTGIQLLPGVPVAALAFVCPVLAAVILVYQEGKIAGVKTLLMRSFDYQRITAKIWFVPILLLLLVVAVLSFVIVRLAWPPWSPSHGGRERWPEVDYPPSTDVDSAGY
jgi:hypothetical protein